MKKARKAKGNVEIRTKAQLNKITNLNPIGMQLEQLRSKGPKCTFTITPIHCIAAAFSLQPTDRPPMPVD